MYVRVQTRDLGAYVSIDTISFSTGTSMYGDTEILYEYVQQAVRIHTRT